MKLRHVLVVVVLLTQHKQHQHNHKCINMIYAYCRYIIKVTKVWILQLRGWRISLSIMINNIPAALITPLLPWPRVWLHFSILVWPPPPPSMASPSHQNLLTSHCRSSSFFPIVTNSKLAYLGLRIVSLCCSFWPAPNLTLVCRAPYYDPKARGVTWSKDHLSPPSPSHLLTLTFPLHWWGWLWSESISR